MALNTNDATTLRVKAEVLSEFLLTNLPPDMELSYRTTVPPIGRAFSPTEVTLPALTVQILNQDEIWMQRTNRMPIVIFGYRLPTF